VLSSFAAAASARGTPARRTLGSPGRGGRAQKCVANGARVREGALPSGRAVAGSRAGPGRCSWARSGAALWRITCTKKKTAGGPCPRGHGRHAKGGVHFGPDFPDGRDRAAAWARPGRAVFEGGGDAGRRPGVVSRLRPQGSLRAGAAKGASGWFPGAAMGVRPTRAPAGARSDGRRRARPHHAEAAQTFNGFKYPRSRSSFRPTSGCSRGRDSLRIFRTSRVPLHGCSSPDVKDEAIASPWDRRSRQKLVRDRKRKSCKYPALIRIPA